MRSLPDVLANAQPLLQAAAGDALDRIRSDREQASDRLKPLLEYLEDHLFDPGLNVNQLKKACGVRDNSIAILFHAQIGRSPKAYISDRRLGTAANLLRDTDLRIWMIAELVGYSGLAVFSKAFSRWAGQRPGAYRRGLRETDTGERDPLDGLLSERSLRRALAGSLPPSEAHALMRRLHEVYDRPQAGTGSAARDGDPRRKRSTPNLKG